MEHWLEYDDHVYIGRKSVYVKGTYDSKWRNPYSIDKYGRDGCIELYKKYITNNKDLIKDLTELEGKTLGCWCSNKEKCHGNILMDLIDNKE